MIVRMGCKELVADDQDELSSEMPVEIAYYPRNRLPSLREEVRHRFAESGADGPVGFWRGGWSPGL